ncbi:MAG: PEP-CTERM sorting domain-containing protein [Planctomycetes bacterium]|nr:PEP-CTERM sorting domain-containing protein [Planctomycetota bacterium]
MKKILTFCAALALTGSVAMADVDGRSAFAVNELTGAVIGEVDVTPTTLPNNVGIQFAIDISGLESFDLQGAGSNVVILFDTLSPGESLNGVGWDLELNGIGPSWLSEMNVGWTDSASNPGVITGAMTATQTGPPELVSSGGVLKFSDLAIADIPLADGIIRIELFESYDDVALAADGFYGANSIVTVQITPEPASLALLAIGGFVIIRRRR